MTKTNQLLEMHFKLLYLPFFAFFVVAPLDEAIAEDREEANNETTTTDTTTTESATEKTTSTEASTTKNEDVLINVYFINDLHYHILPLDDHIYPCNGATCYGGVARLKKKLLDTAEGSSAVLINAGHSFDGELFNAFGFSAFQEAAKLLNFSAQVPSEDLYQFGLEPASKYITSQEANMVCANVKTKNAQKLLTVNDCKISIIGFVEKSRIDSLGLSGLTADEEKKAVEDEVAKANGNIIIVVGSSSLEKAQEIASIDKVNLVLVSDAKGSDDFIWVKVKDSFVGSLGVNDKKLDSIFRIGQITFKMNEFCNVESIEKNLLPYDKGSEEDEVVNAMSPYLVQLLKETTTDVAVNCTGVCQTSECVAGSLVADAIVMFLATVGETTMPKLALVLGRSFSRLFIKDKVNAFELSKMLDNFYLCSVKVNGSSLKQIFEKSVADYKDKETPMENYLQISEFFRVVYNLENVVGRRVEKLQVFSSNSGEWKFIDVADDQDYNVVIPEDLWETTKDLDLFTNRVVLSWTKLDALQYYISITGKNLFVPPLGQRIQYSQVLPDPVNECPNNTGEVIILTLVVVGLLSGLGIFLWKYIYPRYRARRGSTIHLIS